MKRIGIFVCALWLLAAVGGRAQDSGSPKKRKYEHHGIIRSSYQPGNDQTVVTLQPYRVAEEPDVFHPRERVIKLMAAYAFQGRKPAAPNVVEFDIVADTISKARFGKENLELTATVDGEQVSLGRLKAKHDGPRVPLGFDEVNCMNGCRIFHEELRALFTFEGLLRIAQAKKVELRAGNVKLKLDQELLEALRDFTSRATP